MPNKEKVPQDSSPGDEATQVIKALVDALANEGVASGTAGYPALRRGREYLEGRGDPPLLKDALRELVREVERQAGSGDHTIFDSSAYGQAKRLLGEY